LRNTSLRFPQEKIVLLTDVIINAWHLMTRGLYTVPAPVGIYSSKENALKPTDLRAYIQIMKEICPERSEALTSLHASLNSERFPKGIYHWPSSDFTAIHENHFSFFIKTNSNRTTIASPQYPENLKGKILGSGDAYVVHDGLEYFNMMPAWNWKYVPGTTSFPKASTTSPQAFAGNVNNGKSSLTAMKLSISDSLKRQELSALKFWASHDGIIVSLVGDVRGNMSGNAFTTIDQCRWRGDVTVNRPGNILKVGSHKMSNVSWIHHSGFVYITMPFYPTNLNIELKEVSGNWRSVSHSQPEKKVTENVFTYFIDHGHVTEQGYNGYVIAYAPTVADAQAIAAKPQWRVMRNNEHCQGVYFKDGTAMVAFYSGNSPITYENKLSLEASEPCLVLIEDNRIFVSSVDATTKKIRVKWNNRAFSVTTSPLGNAVEGQTLDE
jgi:chondroitin AC lyase